MTREHQNTERFIPPHLPPTKVECGKCGGSKELGGICSHCGHDPEAYDEYGSYCQCSYCKGD